MKRLLIIAIVCLMGVGLAGNVLADSLDGVWKIKSGRWAGGDSDVIYPGDPASDEGAMAFRTFTGEYHIFISSFPTESIFNTVMSKYSVEGNTLHMEKVVTNNPKQTMEWEWTFDLNGDELTLEMEGAREVWVRVK